MKPRVVFDCVVCLQGAARETGSAGACFRLLREGHVTTYTSAAVFAEVAEVLGRPRSQKRFPTLTAERVAAFLHELRNVAVFVDPVSQVFTYPRDPDDEPYVNLALTAGANYLVTWDNDLLDLMGDNPAGADFRLRFPGLIILTPVAFLRELAQSGEAQSKDKDTREQSPV